MLDLNDNEVQLICGGMRLDDFDPSIRVEDHRLNRYYFEPTSGPMWYGYVPA